MSDDESFWSVDGSITVMKLPDGGIRIQCVTGSLVLFNSTEAYALRQALERLVPAAPKSEPFTPLTSSSDENEKQVLAICQALGFGRVMQFVSDEWKKRDPKGALGVAPPEVVEKDKAQHKQQAAELLFNATLNRASQQACDEVRVFIAKLMPSREGREEVERLLAQYQGQREGIHVLESQIRKMASEFIQVWLAS